MFQCSCKLLRPLTQLRLLTCVVTARDAQRPQCWQVLQHAQLHLQVIIVLLQLELLQHRGTVEHRP
jgi:hypothetical protein